jgi:hypothetical protein
MRGSLCGYVVHDDERPVARAAVEAVADGVAEPRTAWTDPAGWFTLDGLAPGDWLLQAWAPDSRSGEASAPVYGNAFSSVTIRIGTRAVAQRPRARDPSFKSWVMRMQHGSVDGYVVRAASGTPVMDAAITVVSGPGAVADIAPLTDERGRFRLDALAPGEWTLRALGPAGEGGTATVRVLSGRVVEASIAVE